MFKRRLFFWGFKHPSELLPVLGPLEHQVMEAVWLRGESSVREVHDGFPTAVAYTTLMTTMDRLYKKGLLARRKLGRAFLYSATTSREQIEHSVTSDLLLALLRQGPDAVLSTLVEAVSESDRALLDELDRLVREKRRQLKKQESE